MKILEISDIHTEFHTDGGVGFLKSLNQLSKQTDVLVIAGDLANHNHLENNISYLCDHWKHIVYVTGNHEYYHKSFPYIHEILDYFKKNKNFHWLDNSSVVIDGQRFIGCTLWFEENNETKFWYNKQQLNDFNFIHDFELEVFPRHDESRRFLENNICSSDIVVAHHSPSFKSVHKRYEKNRLNIYFANELDDLIVEKKPKIWFHGHMHDSFDYIIGQTRIICNPLGYLINDIKHGDMSNPNFNKNNIIEI